MKILLSAYACEPGKGSEPGVGWNWAIELSKLGHDVWVLTRKNNEPVIKKAFQQKQQPDNLHFIYYDLPVWIRYFKKGSRGIYIYYLLWQWGAFKVAKRYHTIEQFEMVHHITFGVVRQPSFMGALKIPFVFGPVGGGEKAPWCLRNGYPLRGKLLDFIRDILNILIKFDPLMHYTFKTATTIYCKTNETKNTIPKSYHNKIAVQLEIGSDHIKCSKSITTFSKKGRLKILYVGRFIYWKGLHLLLSAFAHIKKQYPGVELTMIGKGPDELFAKQLSKQLGVDHAVKWIPWINQQKLSEIYKGHDVLLFPSLHDSSGNVVLEALAHGLPVVCLDLGGPGMIVDPSCGIRINTKGKTEKQVINDLNINLAELIFDKTKLRKLHHGAYQRVTNFTWKNIIVNTVYLKKQ